ncbi:MAG TPA: TetR/AcrR family transcriptional regulator [Planctomycetota bacterium]|nr:TetR/AcrR family transcriptional regulator [Planctomycetota bacterium]
MGTVERRQREAEERRAEIVSAARKVFWAKGYEGATMPEIAAEAELAPGTLYLYFAGKDALYVELLMEGYSLLRGRLAAAAETRGGPRASGEALIDAFIAFARHFPEYFDIMFFVLQRENSPWEGRFAPEQVARLSQMESACHDIVERILERAGYGSPQSRELAVNVVWSMLAGVVFYFRNADDFDRIAAEARRLLLDAIFSD